MGEIIDSPVEPATLEPQAVRYVTFAFDGTLDGCYLQVPPETHADCMIVVDDAIAEAWPHYCANATRDGVELAPPLAIDLAALKAAKNDEINAWRAATNLSTFPHAGKEIACDALSRSDIDGVANNIALFGTFPDGFPGGWKATDNTMVPLADVDAFRAMYASMTAKGTENFNHAQTLKAQLASATTPDEVAAIVW
ncbi:DUF4376 domain-containing protein [Massilia rhizosphaerae]|uniref:DUF4376 domain-containing protein n=1 Tax=Massilia rhizosphaerae TaxID=2784389 RepID=UPI0018DD9449|nr:DUF4376 domain-containing protein [Massilia rhizosphaerae]